MKPKRRIIKNLQCAPVDPEAFGCAITEIGPEPVRKEGETFSHPFTGRVYKWSEKRNLFVWTGETQIPMYG